MRPIPLLVPPEEGWFLVQITGSLSLVTQSGTVTAYTFNEVWLDATGAYSVKTGGRIATMNNPAIPLSGVSFSAGQYGYATAANGAGGIWWQLAPVDTAAAGCSQTGATVYVSQNNIGLGIQQLEQPGGGVVPPGTIACLNLINFTSTTLQFGITGQVTITGLPSDIGQNISFASATITDIDNNPLGSPSSQNFMQGFPTGGSSGTQAIDVTCSIVPFIVNLNPGIFTIFIGASVNGGNIFQTGPNAVGHLTAWSLCPQGSVTIGGCGIGSGSGGEGPGSGSGGGTGCASLTGPTVHVDLTATGGCPLTGTYTLSYLGVAGNYSFSQTQPIFPYVEGIIFDCNTGNVKVEVACGIGAANIIIIPVSGTTSPLNMSGSTVASGGACCNGLYAATVTL